MKRHSSKKGFTLIELLVVVAIIALLIAILIPSLGRAKELANRAACSANLRGMVQTMAIYGNEQNDLFPSVEPSSTAGTAYVTPANTATIGTGTTAGDILSTNSTLGYYNTTSPGTTGAQAGNPLACLWVLTLREGVSPKLFLCKSDPVASQAAPTVNSSNQYLNSFSDGTNNDLTRDSYSIAFPWGKNTNAVGGWWKNLTLADLPVASDMAPSDANNEKFQGVTVDTTSTGSTMTTNNTKAYNSHNHGGDGQNVAYGDNHVEFQKSPLCGQQGDNIFTTDAGGSVTAATHGVTTADTLQDPPGETNTQPFDTVMVPVRTVAGGTQ